MFLRNEKKTHTYNLFCLNLWVKYFFLIIKDHQNKQLYPHITVFVSITIFEIPIVKIEFEAPCITFTFFFWLVFLETKQNKQCDAIIKWSFVEN